MRIGSESIAAEGLSLHSLVFSIRVAIIGGVKQGVQQYSWLARREVHRQARSSLFYAEVTT